MVVQSVSILSVPDHITVIEGVGKKCEPHSSKVDYHADREINRDAVCLDSRIVVHEFAQG